jgi:Zn-dependent M28 family amino/carboxypeptidase
MPASSLLVKGWISGAAAKKILDAAGKDSSLLVSANKKDFKPVALGLKLSVNLSVKAVYNTSQNVIAKITGSKKPDEYIIYTAHWDHFGIGKPDAKGDSIYNGALDNASGTAALLEIARTFKNLKEKPERTVIFLAVTAEEQGLLGSGYYAAHPLYPLNKTVCNINMDEICTGEKTKDIILSGTGQNELEEEIIAIAKTQGRYLAAEAHPEAGHYYRSDHFNFAKAGVPALSFSIGIDVQGKGKDYGKKLEDDFISNNYHKPSDEYHSNWTFAGGMQDMELYFSLGKKLANSAEWPKWKTGSEFKAAREKNQSVQ